MADNEVQELKTFERVFNVVEITIASIGVALNLVTMAMLLTIPGKLKTRVKLLLSLLICDFMLAMMHIVRPLFYFENVWFPDSLDFNVTLTKMEKYFAQTFGLNDFFQIICSDVYFTAQIMGLVTMFALAFDILVLVKYPLHYESLTSGRKGNILLVSIWSGGIVLVLILRLIVELDWFRVIDISWSASSVPIYFLYYTYAAFQVLSNVCFLIFIIVYLVIYVEIRKLIARSPSGESRDTVKATVAMVLILITYLICLMPASWIVLVGSVSDTAGFFGKMVIISRSLYVANTVCDPLIYAIRIPEVRRRYYSVFCKKDRQQTTVVRTSVH